MSSLYGCFSPLFFAMLRLIFITVNSSCSLSSVRYVYISVLKFSDLFVSESFSASISDIFKGVDTNISLKLKRNGICSIIAILYFVFIMLAFFWDIGFQGSFFGCRQSLTKCFFCCNYNISFSNCQLGSWLRYSNL